MSQPEADIDMSQPGADTDMSQPGATHLSMELTKGCATENTNRPPCKEFSS